MGDLSNLPLEGLRSLLDLKDDADCLVDENSWQIMNANSRRSRLTGASPAMLASVQLFELVPELEQADARLQLAELAAGKIDSSQIELRAAAGVDESAFAVARVRRVPGGAG